MMTDQPITAQTPEHAVAPMVIILAAGQGTRMRSKLPKVVHRLAGWPLIRHVLETIRPLHPQGLAVVIGHGAETVQHTLASWSGPEITWVHQAEQLGTGHAVQCALPSLLPHHGEVLILNGDVPLIQPETLQSLLTQHRSQQNALTLLSACLDNPTGYGRILRNDQGKILAIVEHKDASEEVRAIREINTGLYCADLSLLPAWLAKLSNCNAQGEYYLTEIIAIALAQGQTVGVQLHGDVGELSGINTRAELAQMERLYQNRRIAYWMAQGVTFVDPASCWLAPDVHIGMDTHVAPHVILEEGTILGPECQIGPFCQIRRSQLAAGTVVAGFCHVDGLTTLGACTIGPYARIRPETVLDTGVKVGNFCEIKKSVIGAGSKVNHLSYVGDAQLGSGVNVGAGTITCNYDGVKKSRTVIGHEVFIGSNTQLIAPVTIGDRAVIGAGTTVTQDVPSEALAISRTPQRHIAQWRARKKLGA